MLYIRMFLVMTVTLYTSRIILQGLGVENFGIFSVVGGVIGLLAFVNNSMSLSVQRYLSFELGRGDMKRVDQTFGMSLLIHILIALVIGIGLFLSSRYIVDHVLDIPPDRHAATIIFFRFIIISTCLSILQVPFVGLIIAFERMALLAWVSVAEVLLKLLVAFAITRVPYNVLVSYGALLAGVSLVVLTVYAAVCHFNIRSIPFRLRWEGGLFRNLLSFASWSALGEIAWALTIQGVTILINHFAGVICNAGYGIASQISSAVQRFVSSFQTALNPQIIKQYAAEEIESMLLLTFRGIRLSFYLVLLIGLPLVCSMGTILHIWLGLVPEYAVTFSRLIVVAALLDALSHLLATVAKAYGKIRRYQMTVSAVLSLNFLFSWLALRLGLTPYSVVIVYCLVSITLIFVRLRLISGMLQTNIIGQYSRQVLRQVCAVSLLAFAFFFPITVIMDDGVARFILILSLTIVIVPAIIYFLGLDNEEKNFVRGKIRLLTSHLTANETHSK